MNYYAPDGRFGTHTIKVLFQHEQYKGSMIYKMGGNCQGLDIVRSDIDTILDSIENAKFSGMDIALAGDGYEGTVSLTDEKGDDIEIDFYDETELEALIVGVEIVDFKLDENTK